MSLHIDVAGDLTLADDFATKATAILAQRRKGKSYTAAVIAEECVDAGIPFAILDPTGAHWGLRASADGEGPGLPVVILGGEHGDLPLDRSSGKLVADLVLDNPGHYVIDLSLFESKTAEREFVTDFAERLYRRKGQPGMTFVFLLIVDEADMFVPQRHGGDEARMVGAFEAIVRRGGIRGLGVVLVSQRAAVVNKNVLEQIDILIALRTVGPNDQRALDEYVKANATEEERKRFLESLASLKLGEAWFYEPGENLMLRVQVRARRTFNSSATPKPGETRIEPRLLADVDLDRLRAAMQDAALPEASEDPDVLRKEVARLRAELDARPAAAPERVPVPYVPKELKTWLDETREIADSAREYVVVLRQRLVDLGPTLDRLLAEADAIIAAPPAPARRPRSARQAPAPAPAAPPAPRARPADTDAPTDPEERILRALAPYPSRTKQQVALLAHFTVKGSHLKNTLSRLRNKGWVDGPGDDLRVTDAGRAALGPYEPHPTGGALLDYWCAQPEIGEPGVRVLRALDIVYPSRLTKQQVADHASFDPAGSHLKNTLSKLRTLGLIEGGAAGMKLADDLAG